MGLTLVTQRVPYPILSRFLRTLRRPLRNRFRGATPLQKARPGLELSWEQRAKTSERLRPRLQLEKRRSPVPGLYEVVGVHRKTAKRQNQRCRRAIARIRLPNPDPRPSRAVRANPHWAHGAPDGHARIPRRGALLVAAATALSFWPSSRFSIRPGIIPSLTLGACRSTTMPVLISGSYLFYTRRLSCQPYGSECSSPIPFNGLERRDFLIERQVETDRRPTDDYQGVNPYPLGVKVLQIGFLSARPASTIGALRARLLGPLRLFVQAGGSCAKPRGARTLRPRDAMTPSLLLPSMEVGPIASFLA